MGLNPTINWCMFTGTPFLDSVQGFMNWYHVFQVEPEKYFDAEHPEEPIKNLNKKSFALCGHTFVSAMEQVLGYMNYVTEQLKPTDKNYLVLKARAEVCMEAIDAEMKEIIPMMNAFLQEISRYRYLNS